MRIFIVENHRDTLKYLTMFLGLLGYRVENARTMEEALLKVSETNCDVLISDLGLPDGDGWQLLQKMPFSHRVYAIAVSGFGTEADIAKSRSAGYRHHLVKPFGADDLLPLLEEARLERAA